jgi:hypothetical protein
LSHEPPPDGLEVVLMNGPFASMTPLGKHLLDRPAPKRPALALALSEQLPDPNLPEWWRTGLGRLRSWLEHTAHRRQADGRWVMGRGWQRALGWGFRYRYYGDLLWLREAGVLRGLALWSFWTANFLRQRGFDPVVLEPGLIRNMGEDLGLERDIPVLWLGQIGGRRRGRMLARLRKELEARGVPLMVVDGVERPAVHGRARTELLNRTKIMLNLLRYPWDDNSLRYALAANNRALLVSEPSVPHTRFEPGVHVVEAPAEQLADTIVRYLDDVTERERLVENAFQLLRSAPPRGELLEKMVMNAAAKGVRV